ncbi:unnamed protein product [Arctogadus glacialis]
METEANASTTVIMERNELEEEVKTLQRSINCLLDEDRNIRKTGLAAVLSWLTRQEARPALVVGMFQRHIAAQPHPAGIADKIERTGRPALACLTLVLQAALLPTTSLRTRCGHPDKGA